MLTKLREWYRGHDEPSPLNTSTSTPPIGGSIAHFGLAAWWMSSFSEVERCHIQRTYRPLGSSGSALTEGKVGFTTETAVGLLSNLAGWFTKPEERVIAHRMLAKAEELAGAEGSVLTVHFHHHSAIEAFYRGRSEPGLLDKAVEACRKQIALAPRAAQAFQKEWGMVPGHKGYHQVAVILEKQKRFSEVIELCAQAAAEGWQGDWELRIERCRRKIAKAPSHSSSAQA